MGSTTPPTQPVLKADGLLLKPLSEKLLTARYVTWLNDPETVRFSEQRHRQHNLAGCLDYLRQMQAAGNMVWAIMPCQPALGHIGNISVHLDWPNRTGDIAILVGERRARGQGFAKAAWKAVSSWLLTDGGLRKVTAGTLAVNAPMRAVATACGMQEEGRRISQFLWEQQEIDLVMYARFAGERPAGLRATAGWNER